MDTSSFKKHIVLSICSSLKAENFKKNSVIVMTSAGLIIGDPLVDPKKFETVEDIKGSVLEFLADTFTKYYREDNDIDGQLPGNDGFFILRNARLLGGAQTVSMGDIAIFFDQVIGITIGNISD